MAENNKDSGAQRRVSSQLGKAGQEKRKQEKLARALKANLLRRKDAQKARREPDDDSADG